MIFSTHFASDRSTRFFETGDYYSNREGYETAASGRASASEDGATPEEALSVIYRLLQNANIPWTEHPAIHTVVTERPRSLSVGDVIEIAGHGAWEVAPAGFTRLKPAAAEKAPR